MSLRVFHIIFLISVVSLFLFLSYWNYENWNTFGQNSSLLYIGMSLIAGVIVTFYGIKFYKKTKELNG